MANQTKTVTSRINFFGPSPSQRWGASNGWNSFTWGSNTWGEKRAGVGGTPPLIFSVFKVLGAQTLVASSGDFVKTPRKVFGASISWAYGNTDVEVSDGAGYAYIYPDRVSNVVSASSYSYSSGAVGTSGWTLVSTTDSTWS